MATPDAKELMPEQPDRPTPCTCASKPPTVPEYRDRLNHLPDCPLKGTSLPVGVTIDSLVKRANRLAAVEARFAQFVRDTAEGMECLPGCDSVAHEPLCPLTNTVEAWRQLRQRLAAVEEIADRLLRDIHTRDWFGVGCVYKDLLALAPSSSQESPNG